MKEEFDFDKIGKQMPYKVPAGFFDRVTERTLAAAENRARSSQQPEFMQWRVLSVAASLAALLLVGYFLYIGYSGNSQQKEIITAAAPPNKAAAADSPVFSAPTVTTRQLPPPEPAIKPKKASAPLYKQHPSQISEPEKLEEILTSITDEELVQLTTMASAEEYVIEQTIN